MNVFVLIILIVGALVCFGVKQLKVSYQCGTLSGKLEKAARKALQITLTGIMAVGFACLVLLCFPFVKSLGLRLLSENTVSSIRRVLDAVFNTRSVYAVVKILASIGLATVSFSLIFSILGFFAVKTLGLFHALEWAYEEERKQEQPPFAERLYNFKKIFLNFANLKL